MKKNWLSYICVATLLSGALTSCNESNFLDLSDPNHFTENNFWKNKADAESGLAAAYSPIKYQMNGYYGAFDGWLNLNSRGDDIFTILNGVVKPVPQEEMAIVGELRPAPKIFKETCRIDWKQPVKKVYDFIRGLSPYPAAWSELVSPEGEVVVVKIFESEKVSEAHQLSAGTIVTDGKKYIKVAVPDGFVSVLSLQLPGKKRLKTDELLRGFRLTNEYKMN